MKTRKKNEFSRVEIAAYYAQRVPDLKQTGTELRGPCPIHQGTRDSFAVNPETGLWYCHSECDCGGSMIQLEMAINEVDYKTARNNVRAVIEDAWRVVAKYTYVDEASDHLYRVVRRELGEGPLHEKDFYQQRYESSRWVNGLGKVRRVLYHLDEVVEAKHVFITEGEKDCDTIRDTLRFHATTNPMGARKWSSDYNKSLEGRRVTFTPHNDDTGRAHVLDAAENLLSFATSIRVLELPNFAGKRRCYGLGSSRWDP